MANTNTSSKERSLCLENLREGAALERFNDEIGVVLKNIVDPNTSHKKKRSITLKVTFEPNENRDGMVYDIAVSSVLAPPKSVDGFAYVAETKDGVVATEYNPRQQELPMIGKKTG